MVQLLLGYQMTEHALMRCQQRGVAEADLFAVFYFGAIERTHGCLRYVLTDRVLANTPLAKDADRLRGLTLVVDPKSNEVVTVKRQFTVSRRPGVMSKRHLLAQATDRDYDNFDLAA